MTQQEIADSEGVDAYNMLIENNSDHRLEDVLSDAKSKMKKVVKKLINK